MGKIPLPYKPTQRLSFPGIRSTGNFALHNNMVSRAQDSGSTAAVNLR